MIINYLPFLSLSTEILLGHPYRLKQKRFFFSSSNKRLCITKWHTKKKEHIDCNKTSLAKEIYQWYHSLIYESSHTCRMAWKYGTGAWLKIASLQIRQGWGGRRVWTPHFLYFVHIYNWLLPLSCGSHLLFFFFIVKYCTNLLADFSLFFLYPDTLEIPHPALSSLTFHGVPILFTPRFLPPISASTHKSGTMFKMWY